MIDAILAPLTCAYLPLEAFPGERQRQSNALGAMCFSADSASIAAASSTLPLVPVPMPALDVHGKSSACCEVWGAQGEARYGRRGQLIFGHDAQILFGAIQLPEAQFDSADSAIAGKTPLQQASETAYRSIFSLMDELEFPHVLRFWNYIAHINIESHGIERYRQFNIGRQDAFLGSGRMVAGGAVPAASAVGCDPGPLTVYFLAGRGAMPVAVENPRQVSAYDYPSQYGPRAPTFSRASVARLGDADVLFLSGTASIVGHRSVHVGDLTGQVHETLANIRAMVDEANRVSPDANFTMRALCYKVYVRHAKDTPAIDAELRRALGMDARLLYLRADICREDLLLEIEATAGHPMELALPAGV